MTDGLTDTVLAGLAVYRASGAPALACVAGYRSVDGSEASTTLGAATAAGGRAGACDLAMMVDLAAGAAIRREVGSERRLATTALAVQLLGELPSTADLTVHVPAVQVRDRWAVASTTVLAGGQVLGHGTVAFAVLGGGLTPIPWEHPGPTPTGPLVEDDLTADERKGLRAIRSAGDFSWAEAVLRGATRRTADETVLAPTALLANRAGGVQGGVLVGLAVLAAAGAPSTGVLSSVQVDFVAAARVDAPVRARVDVLREGRRSRLVRLDLVQEGMLVVAATVGLRTED